MTFRGNRMKPVGMISGFRAILRLFAEITFSHTSWGSVLSRAVQSAHLAPPTTRQRTVATVALRPSVRQ
jgi:hypothetical protein